MFGIEYYIGTIAYLLKELGKIPVIKAGRHVGLPVIRVYTRMADGKLKVTQTKIDSDKGKELLKIAARRDMLARRAAQLSEELKSNYHVDYDSIISQYTISDVCKHRLNTSFWNTLGGSVNTYPKENDYYHKSDQLRSRVESRLVEILDGLGLEYRYEVRIQVGNNPYDVDIVIHLPQFNCCFMIEYFGSMNSPRRVSESQDKIINYSKAGILSCRDIIFLCGTDNSMPSTEMVEEIVTGFINGISRQHVFIK